MKKVLLIIFLLFVALPTQGIFAYSGGLLNGKPLILGTDIGVGSRTITQVTDGDESSGNSELGSSNNTLWYRFDTPVTLGSYKGRVTSSLELRLYDTSKKILKTFKLSDGAVSGEFEAVGNVSYVAIYNTGTAYRTVYEFDVFSPESLAEEGLLRGKAIRYGTTSFNGNDSTLLLTDGKNSTGKLFNSSSESTIWYNANPNLDLDAIRLFVSNNDSLLVKFYNPAGDVIWSQNVVGNGEKKMLSAPVTGVPLISIFVGARTVYELDVYGKPQVPSNTDSSLFVINNLDKKIDSGTSISLTWSPINSIYLKKYNVYQDDILIGTVNNNVLNISGLVPGQSYVFKVTPVDTFDKEFSGNSLVYDVPLPDTTPPGIPKNLKVVPDRYTASLSWDAPSDPDLLGYYIYLDDNRVNSSPQLNNNYVVTGLSIDSDYKIDVVAVDLSGNMSAHSTPLHFRTLTLQTIPAAPGNLIANSFYKGANLTWLPSSSAKEYIVYMDGKQLFKTVQTSAKVTNLTNGKSYSFEVTAMNEIGESDKVGPVLVMPLEASPVDVTLGYSLKDISDGTANMFSAQWLLLAFAICIPLSFYISNRVKGLFTS